MLDDILKALVTQFPVVAVVAVIVWWILRWTAERHDAETGRNDRGFAQLIAEKDTRLAEKDRLIAKLETEVAELKAKLSRSRKKGKRKPRGKNP